MVLQYRTISFLQQKSLWKSWSDSFYLKISVQQNFHACTLILIWFFNCCNRPTPRRSTIKYTYYPCRKLFFRKYLRLRYGTSICSISLDPPKVKFFLSHYFFCRTTVLLPVPGTVLKAVLRNRIYFLRSRFRLLTSYGSDSDFWQVMVPIPAPVPVPLRSVINLRFRFR